MRCKKCIYPHQQTRVTTAQYRHDWAHHFGVDGAYTASSRLRVRVWFQVVLSSLGMCADTKRQAYVQDQGKPQAVQDQLNNDDPCAYS